MKNKDIKKLIFQQLRKKKQITTADIVKRTGFSRVYVNRFLRELRDAGKIVLLGKANRARYILAKKALVAKAKREFLSFHKILENKGLAEDIILDEIKRDTGIFLKLPKNVLKILDYAFSEMLNNAIEHSQSKTIKIKMKREARAVRFDVADRGIGIFHHIMKKKNLRSELEAIQDLLKGKQTTAPKEHTGEGIFFTSKVADILIFQSSNKKLTFNNILEDVFIEDVKFLKGTKVMFHIGLKSKRRLDKVFQEYSGDSYEFSKTKVIVKLYKMDTDYISRSQARRVLSGLDAFKTIILDFTDVKTVGQAFADEVFRVWQSRHTHIAIIPQNANENIRFMIRRAAGENI